MPDIRIVVVGDGVAGKTALIRALCSVDFMGEGNPGFFDIDELGNSEIVQVFVNGMAITTEFKDTLGQVL